MKQYKMPHLLAHWRLWMTLTILGLLGGVSWAHATRQAADLHVSSAASPATVVLARAAGWPTPDAEVETLVRQTIEAAGGLNAIVHNGDTVVIKPNLMWGAAPDEGYTTDPRVVRALVRLAQEAGAAKVIIADGAARYREERDDRSATVEAFRRCGYDVDGNLVDDETGAQLVDLNDSGGLDQHDPSLVTQVNIPNGLIRNSYWLPRVVIEADVLISVPVLKNHSLGGVTLALKNQFGTAPSDIYHSPGSSMYKGALEHGPNELGRHIVNLNLARRPDFVVVDGLRGMTNGPDGGTLANPRMRLIMAGADPVAVDTVGALVMGYDPATIPYLAWAAEAGLGNDDVAQITVRGVNGERVSQVRRNFPAPYGDPPAQRAESTPPTVHIAAPASGSLLTTTTTIQATAEDNQAIAKVEFYAGADLLSTVTTVPYQATVDLSRYQGQAVSLRAVSYDRALNDAQDSVSVSVIGTPTAGAASFMTTTISIPTYQYTPFLQIRSAAPYTYHWLDWSHFNYTQVTQNYQLLVLENDYLRVTILPELGGRVYQLIYKPTGSNELYQNPVIKPTHWGPTEQGWWLAAGGIEWCLPVEEHGYEWSEPWAWSVVTATAGVTVTVRDTDAANRLRAAIDLFLPSDRAYLAITPHLENPTSADVSYKYWTNAMLAPGPANTVGPDLRFIFNASQVTVHSSGDPKVPAPGQPMDWPVSRRDFSRLGNWHEWLGFFERPQAAADFVGVYDTAVGEGVARVFPSSVVRGTKGFGMGWGGYQIDPGTWTDDGSTYVELHGGVAPTFWDTAMLTAGTTLAWTEYWYPVGNIGVFSDATAEATLAVRQEGESIRVGVHSTAARAAEESTLYVWDRATCAELGRWSLPTIDPATPFSATTASGGRTVDQVAVAYLDSQGKTLARVHPVNCLSVEARVEPLPRWVETTTFTVTWVKPVAQVGIGTFQVQFRDGYGAAWTDWLTSTNAVSGTFTGDQDHTYFFRARTIAPNQMAWSDEEWGQAFTTVLTQPAPVLVTSRKEAIPASGGTPACLTLVPPGELISYTLLVSNTGNLTASAFITDSVPGGTVLLTQTLTIDSDPPPTYTEDGIFWNGEVNPVQTIRLSYMLSPTADIEIGDRITNTAQIVGSILGQMERQAVAVQAWTSWLPVVMKR